MMLRDCVSLCRYFSSAGIPFKLKTEAFAREWVSERGIRVGIHVRRGDQLTPQHGGKDPGVGYFAEALQRLPVKGPAVVCTDDVAWVKAQSLFDGMWVFEGDAAQVRSSSISSRRIASCTL
jgi:hypothetical protein